MTSHDPTPLNMEERDSGAPHRSVIYDSAKEQQEIVKEAFSEVKN
jgi:peptide methionine sulfoxide reductase MsrA